MPFPDGSANRFWTGDRILIDGRVLETDIDLVTACTAEGWAPCPCAPGVDAYHRRAFC